MRTLLVVAVVLAGCGGSSTPPTPDAGDACGTGAAPLCTSSAQSLFCESSKWVAYTCPGGCDVAADGGLSFCRPGPDSDGQPCPETHLNVETCAGPEKRALCTPGRWLVVPCAGCSTASGAVVCN